jgi:hypothetical protein
MKAKFQELFAEPNTGEFVSFLTAFLLAYEPAKRLARWRWVGAVLARQRSRRRLLGSTIAVG